jgi:hypothetical protein
MMTDLPFVSVKDAIECYRNEVNSEDTKNRFSRCIETFNLKDHENIIPFLYMIVREPESFKNKLPKDWRQDSTKAVGVSSINKCVNISIIKKTIGQGEVDTLRKALSAYIKELQNKKKDTSNLIDGDKVKDDQISSQDDDKSSIANDTSDYENCLIVLNQLKKENQILKFQNERLFKMLSAFALGETKDIYKEWLSLTSELFNLLS